MAMSDLKISPSVLNDTIYVTITDKNLKPYEGYMTCGFLNFPIYFI